MEMLYIGLSLSGIVAASGLALSFLFKSSKGTEEASSNNITINNNCGTGDDLLRKENEALTNRLRDLEKAQENLKSIFDKKTIEEEARKYDDLINKYKDAIVVEKEVVKEVEVVVNNETALEDMYCIDMHGFSINNQYEYRPYGVVRKTNDYIKWQKEFMARFNELGIKDEILRGLDTNKKIRAEYAFIKYSKNDVDNFIKSLTDTLVKCLGLEDDNNFEAGSYRVIENVSSKDLGKIYFKLSNIE